MKKTTALLVVSFGTSYDDTRMKTIDCLESELEETFTEVEVKRAWTNPEIISKIRSRDDIRVLNVEESMGDLIRNGYAQVAIQPTEIINGVGYEKMVRDICRFRDEIRILGIGEPLLTFSEDYEKVCSAIMEDVGPLKDDEALLLMGRGNKDHHADAAYAALDYRFKSKGYDNVHIATLDGFPEIAHSLTALRKTKVKKVKLMPLMLTVGKTVLRAMAGEDHTSWASMLSREGYQVEPLERSLGENRAIRQIFIEHAKKILHKG